ncbi:hypothetical protein GCM10009808_09720 [Microbacterium sediminicola]|uniref:ECF transporter S component n=1 Tax=Microbacterium sediminicola TaxID=415210 RepID=A0ABP4TVK3_9MICO
MQDHDQPAVTRGPEQFTEDFQLLRMRAGGVSYSQIAVRLQALREQRGLNPGAAYIARSTVYDVFRPGRRRINPDLVADIATVLGEDDERVEYWRDYSIRSRTERAGTPASSGAEASPATRDTSAPATPRPAGPDDATAAHSSADTVAAHASPWQRTLTILAVLLIGVLVNVLGTQIVLVLSLPLFLDMIGTAVVAIALGPWFGVMVALLTHLAVALSLWSLEGIPFTIVNVAGALVWGYGVRAWRLGTSSVRFFVLNVIVAVTCTLIAVPIILFAMGGFSEHIATNSFTQSMLVLGQQLWGAAFSANMITSLIDKLITGFIAMGMIPLVFAILDRGAPGMPRPDLFLRQSSLVGAKARITV